MNLPDDLREWLVNKFGGETAERADAGADALRTCARHGRPPSSGRPSLVDPVRTLHQWGRRVSAPAEGIGSEGACRLKRRA